MNRKQFLKRSLLGLSGVAVLPAAVKASCTTTDCSSLSPSETAGPFPIKSPADLVRENIIGDRNGIPLLIELTILDQNDDCSPLAGVYVDLWHCDADGNYSEYGGTPMQSTNYTGYHFLRGRQTTDVNGKVSFVSVFPGWYQGRAPHIHLEVLDANESVIRTSQIAFEKNVCDTVYASSPYRGEADTLNANDNVFGDSLAGNMYDSISGNNSSGYTLCKSIVVNADGHTTIPSGEVVLSGLSGNWYDPDYDGSGFQVTEVSDVGLSVIFYGYTATGDGDAHWLISGMENAPSRIIQGQSYTLTAYSSYLGNGGSLTQKPVGEDLEEWGTMSVTFDSCDGGTITLSGNNGQSMTFSIEKLASISGLTCEQST